MSCDHHWLVYRTVRSQLWTVRYRRCRHCGATSKTVAVGYVDARNWCERKIEKTPLLDGPLSHPELATIANVDSENTSEGMR